MLQNAIIRSRAHCCDSGEDARRAIIHTVAMAKKAKKPKHPRNFLREWREFRELTQEQLASALKPPTKASVISLLENSDRGLSQKWLERLAPALGVRKGFIAEYPPESLDMRALEIFGQMPEDDQRQALSILETFQGRASK